MDVHQCPLLTLSGHQSSISPDWSPVGSACYFLIIIVIRHETASAARWALLLIVRTLFDHAITVAVRTGFSFHVCLPADIFASLTHQRNAPREHRQLCDVGHLGVMRSWISTCGLALQCCRLKHCTARTYWSRISGPILARGAKNYLVQRVTDGAQSRRICSGIWRSPDRRNCQDGTAPSRSPVPQGRALQSIPALGTYSTGHDWASLNGGSNNLRPTRR